MKFCQPHWDDLKTAIKDRGLWHLVAADGRAAMDRAIDEMNRTATDKAYDPLMAAHWSICGQAMKQGGLYLMSGDYCPLCELEKHTEAGMAKRWVDGCTDSILSYCQERGLVPRKQ